MTSPVGNQHNAGVVQRSLRPQAPSEETFPGKSADSVGHLAKVSVVETGDSEPGAQGRAASRIARMDVTVLPSTGSDDSQVPDTGSGGSGTADQPASDNAIG
ncbi:conserved hypothetical protein [Mesorhizobium sp. ORS 3324]|nr:conserved hypothetical protein [Mesorhizobium sp. ORS 3324]